VNVGGDYFVTKKVALKLDLRGTFFPDADISVAGRTVAACQPINFIGLFGVRWFPW
jgi:outer membrane protein